MGLQYTIFHVEVEVEGLCAGAYSTFRSKLEIFPE